MTRRLTLPQLKKYDVTQKVIEALADSESRAILFSIIKTGMTAAELSDKGVRIVEEKQTVVINLQGRVFLPPLDCLFRTCKDILDNLPQGATIRLVDFHEEATSEKQAMGWFLDGRVSLVIGTYTHVQTADELILPKGTAYITDIGMTGPLHSVIGVKKELAIEKFLTGMPKRFEVASGPSVFCAVLLELDARLGKAVAFERIRQID